ncbi:MAG: lysophospholipid acyltransferase family protein [Candidatus Krumholzibacteria bacterium]|jgi:KDO2-lipid IV(A) lauroyltransferase|nr:lysophospholipid acyltransferase family protein [Candidatus Krumholzibacteria bacterium]
MSVRLPLWRRLRRWFWYQVAVTMLATVHAMPPTAGRRLCRSLAAVGLRLRRREREMARRNLTLVFPERSLAWREELLGEAAAALGENLYAALTVERQAARGFPAVVEAAGPDGSGLVDCLRDLQQARCGVILLAAHIGCWELLGAWLAARLDRPAVITGTVRNPAVDHLLQARRRRLGLEPLPRDAGARPLLRALARGAVVGVLLDQNTGAANIEAPFLGHPAPTPVGPLRVAKRYDVPLVPAALVREDDRWVVRHLAAIEPAAAPDVAALATVCNAAIARLVRRNPAQWVWFHDRWGLQARTRRVS